MQDFATCKEPDFAGTEPKLFPLKREISKILLVMKITAILLLVATLQVSAKGWGQEKITLSVNDAPLEQVFSSIKSQTGISFVYRPEYVKGKKVTMRITNASLKDALDICLKKQDLTYEVVGKNVVIYEVKKENKPTGEIQNNASLNYLLTGTVDITGRVTNEQGEPLSGANITVKRTGIGTITNGNGQFTLRNVTGDDVIIFSYVGYSPLSIKVGDKTNFIVTMNIAANKLDAAVVQAYGNTTERLRTGNISTVTAAEIEQQPVMNVLQALQGKVPGLEVTAANGYASSSYKIEIRGRKYMSNVLAPDPLIIVDGVPITVLNFQGASPDGTPGFDQAGVPNPVSGRSPLFSIDPSEIESITVLKDADATAIYGSRGGSGVIIINTKKAKAGKTTFRASYNTGFQKNLRFYDLLNTQQYLMMRREALQNDNLPINASNAIDLVDWDTTRYTNWQRFLYGGVGRVNTADASVTGGDKLTKFRISMNYDSRQSITATSGSNNRVSFISNVSHASTNNVFKFDLTSYYSSTKVNEVGWPIQAVLLPPNAPSVFNDMGKLNYTEWDKSGTSSLLDMFQTLVQKYVAKTAFLNNRFGITVSPLKGLSFKTNLGYSSVIDEANWQKTIASQNPRRNPTGTVNDGITKSNTWIIEPQAEYKYLNKLFTTELLVGSTYQFSSQKTLTISGRGYTDDNLLNSVMNAPIKYGTDNSGQYKYFALFGRVNINVLNKYVINLTGRRDGSSRFGPGRQYGNFGSIGGAWILSDEKWFKPLLNIISFAKIRSSYGTVGSDNINDYVYLTRWTTDINIVNPYGGTSVYAPTQHANPTLQWQQNKKFEVAGSLNFFKDRLNIDVSWYRDRCSNQLLQTPLPVLTGFPIISTNLPATVQNSGIELKFNGLLVKGKLVNVSANFNIGQNRNKLLAFPGIENTPYSKQYIIGKPLNTRYVVHYLGVDPTTGKYSFEDKNKDGIIDITSGIKSADVYGLDLTPRYFGGGGFDVSLHSFSLSTYFTFANLRNVQRAITIGVPGEFGTYNQSIKVLNRWEKSGDQSEFEKFKTAPTLEDQIYGYSDGIYSKAVYLRCQNISLNYSLPSPLLRKVGCQAANVFVRAENVFLITNYDGLDPSAPSLGGYPQPFTLTMGTTINF